MFPNNSDNTKQTYRDCFLSASTFNSGLKLVILPTFPTLGYVFCFFVFRQCINTQWITLSEIECSGMEFYSLLIK